MKMSYIPFFLTTGTPAEGALMPGGGLLGLVPILLVFVIMYFFMIRPQNKKQKETEKMIAALKKGDKVITIGGIHGTVATTKENTVILKVDDGARIEFNRTAIATVIVDKPASSAAQPEEKKGLFGKKTKEDKIVSEIKDSDSDEASADSDSGTN